jgi:hypothetical protein
MHRCKSRAVVWQLQTEIRIARTSRQLDAGLCCDGTLVEFVEVADGVIRRLSQQLGEWGGTIGCKD